MTTTALAPRAQAVDRRDLVGLAVAASAVVWTFVVAASGGDPWPTVGTFALAAVAYALGRVAPYAVLALVVTLAIVLGLLLAAGVLSSAANAAPFGYVNARSAFFVEAATATVMVALLVRGRRGRIIALAGAIILAAVPLFNRSEAASFVVILLPAAAALALEGRRLVLAVWLSGALMLASVAATSFVAAAPPDSVTVRLAADVLEEPRIALWRDAVDLILEDPLTGVGPGRFASESEGAQADRDARWAHHGFLQQGAETGIVGLALLVLMFVWGFWRLASVSPSGMAVMGAFALAAIGVLACSDYVFHFPLVTGTTAALVGAAVSSGRAAEEARRPSEVASSRWEGAGRAGAEMMLDAGVSRNPSGPNPSTGAEGHG
jgi:O-antigen ligase